MVKLFLTRFSPKIIGYDNFDQMQSFPNTVGPWDLTGKVCAGPGENLISPNRMSGKILAQECKFKWKIL